MFLPSTVEHTNGTAMETACNIMPSKYSGVDLLCSGKRASTVHAASMHAKFQGNGTVVPATAHSPYLNFAKQSRSPLIRAMFPNERSRSNERPRCNACAPRCQGDICAQIFAIQRNLSTLNRSDQEFASSTNTFHLMRQALSVHHCTAAQRSAAQHSTAQHSTAQHVLRALTC